MLGSGYYLVGALALVFLQPSVALNAKTANAVCNLLKDGLMIFSGDVCGNYYSCLGGLASMASCAAGYSFSKNNQGCLPAASVTCGESDTNPCDNVATGSFVAVPNSCTDFYYCNNGVGSKGSCPTGLNFDPVDQSCNYTIDYACGTTNSGSGSSGDSTGDDAPINLCAVVPGGVFFGSSTSCQAWQQCTNGALAVGICPSPYYFNVLTAACDYQENVSCRQVTGDPSTGTDPGYLSGTSCPTNGLVVSDNSTCTGYYTCNNNIYSYGACAGGLYYNPGSASCVNRLYAVNNCNRCEGTTLEFVNLYQDNCEGYGYCSSGRMASTGTCPDGYFDEVAQACIVEDTEPQYPVCNDALSGLTTASSDTNSTTDSSAETTTVASGETTDANATTIATTAANSNATTTTVVTTLGTTGATTLASTVSTTAGSTDVTTTLASTTAETTVSTTTAAPST